VPGAKHLCSCSHAEAEFLRECRKRRLVDAQCAQAVPGKGHRYPAGVLLRSDNLGASDFLQDAGQPLPALACIVEGQEFIARCQGRRAGNEKVLDVMKLQHCALMRHCIWSSISEKALFNRSAFLISSAVT
jgi:hypothetical protein